MDAQLAHSTPTPSGYNPVLSRCVESSSLMNEELEALFSLPLTQGPGNAPCMKATDHEAGTGDASPEYNSAAPLAPGFGIVQASMPAHCVDLSALLSPPSHESSSSGAMSPGLAIEGSHPLVSPGSKRPDRGDGEILTVQGYCWKDNSCWLDSSLELIFQTAQRDWEGFARRFSNAPFSIKLHRVHDTLAPRHRLTVEGPPKDLERDLSAQRDQLREVLLKWGAIKLMQSREPSFAWLSELLRLDTNDSIYDARSYFEGYSAQLRTCTGTADGRGYTHCQVRTIPIRHFFYQLTDYDLDRHRGSVVSWLQSLLEVGQQPEALQHCWKTLDATPLCNGKAQFMDLHFSLPVMLIIELGSSCDTEWDFPSTVCPLQRDSALNGDEPGIAPTSPEYRLVGRLLYGSTGHFLCRYAHSSGASCVYEYDGLVAKGTAKILGDGEGKNILAGPGFVSPTGHRTHCVVYSLHGGAVAQRTLSSILSRRITRLFPLQIISDPTAHGGAPSIVFHGQQDGAIPTPAEDHASAAPPREAPAALQEPSTQAAAPLQFDSGTLR
ncbi:hypothetical protein FOMPIDRAFT_156703 [Fomitopsis schrenkii]|uniref:Uncharacterized protein n=1 Tax=Fomitopsis schrenkii TaxID=2126942 RepID=S8E2I7_FOMSC|nr:hypothetical protein FOMPIDRAFT_156703 [Fomitopsis schrenkii]